VPYEARYSVASLAEISMESGHLTQALMAFIDVTQEPIDEVPYGLGLALHEVTAAKIKMGYCLRTNQGLW
jgi:hypothetical protein